MTLHRIEAKSILIKRQRIDSWFVARYGLNIYRGCVHACTYCDGRNEKYRVEGDFGTDVVAKINAPVLLERALDCNGRRKPLKPSFVFLGGGVGDSYQPAELDLGLTRQCLEVLERAGWPVCVLTKSSLVERDLDVLDRIDRRRRCLVCTSLSSANDDVSSQFEPGASPPSARLAALRKAKQRGLATGVYLMPIIPFVTDSAESLAQTMERIRETGADFVVFGGMTLKAGRQRQHFLEKLSQYLPGAIQPYRQLYREGCYNGWGHATESYCRALDERCARIAKEHGLPCRIPPRLYRDVLEKDDLVQVVLEQLDYCLRVRHQQSSPFGRAAFLLSRSSAPLNTTLAFPDNPEAVTPAVEEVIREVLRTGTSSQLESLL
ncbi:MAG: radical SAM protein [Pseudomonadota bacterium]